MKRVVIGGLFLVMAGVSACEEGLDDIVDVGSDVPDDVTSLDPDWSRPGVHPCAEYRVNAFLAEDDGETLWVGCGAGTTGFGLFVSADGGATWSEPETTPIDYFGTFRVLSVQRASDGLLYVGGSQTTNSTRVAALDTETMEVEPVMEEGGAIIGTFLRNDAGVAVAESLTGQDISARASDGGTFALLSSPFTDGVNRQILDMQLYGGEFYAVGSTIAAPHVVMLPAEPEGDAPVAFTPVEFATTGELWGVAVDDGGVVAAGVEQGANYGIVYLAGDDANDADSWTAVDARATITRDLPSRFYGVCRSGERIAAVGDYSTRSEALVILSTDGGTTWEEVSPSDGPIIDDCYFDESGELLVVGGGGYIARYQP